METVDIVTNYKILELKIWKNNQEKSIKKPNFKNIFNSNSLPEDQVKLIIQHIHKWEILLLMKDKKMMKNFTIFNNNMKKDKNKLNLNVKDVTERYFHQFLIN